MYGLFSLILFHLQSKLQHVLMFVFDQFVFSVFQDSSYSRKLQQGSEPGAREPGEGAGESTLLHDDHGDSSSRAEC